MHYPISKTTLQKFLYKSTTELSDENPLKNTIPFYWYIHGPYSPPLITLNETLLEEDILKPKGKGYIASTTRLCKHDEFFEEARTALTKMIGSVTSANSTTVIEDLYAYEAPYQFYISFKSRFTAMLYNYLHDAHSRFKTEQLENILHQTIGELPNEPLFSRFKYAYLDFIDIMIKVIKLDLPDNSKKDIETISWNLFETFAKGVRILHHDDYFDVKVPNWKTQFEDSINEMEQNIDQLHELSQNLGSKTTNRMTFQKLIERILNLKSKNELIMVSFLPSQNDSELNYGKIDAELFKQMNDDEFKALLKKFECSHNAIVHHSTKKDMESTTYRLLAS